MSRYQKTEDFNQTINDFARGRLSAAMAPVATFVTRSNSLGQPIRPNDLLAETAKSALPLPIPSGAVTGTINTMVTGQPQQAFAGQFQKQLMSSFGVRTEQAPAAGQRIAALASDFNRQKGIEPDAQFYSGDYQALTSALRVGNKPAAVDAMQDLLQKKTPTQIDEHYQRWPSFPVTGSQKSEGQFIQTLSPEQVQQYYKSRTDKANLAISARQLLRASVQARAQPQTAASQ